jgi:HPt (histidine-containing phosphotransfer) domain-containing protein
MPEPTIDPTAFAELLENVGGDREFVAELVGTYLSDSPGLFAELRAAIAADDAATARRAAHTLKSTSASFGARALADRCREIELAAAGGQLDGMTEQVDLAEALYRAVATALEAEIAGSRAGDGGTGGNAA